jgi:RNA polymerase sigma factor (sigma-70 family)
MIANPDTSRSNATVFIIDDDHCVLESIDRSLRTTGFEIEAFSLANEFLAALDESRSGCVVTDVRMPGMSGLQLQSELHARHAHIPVILISGHGDVSMVVTAMKNGAIDFLEKPYDPKRLRECVIQAVERDAVQRRQIEEQNRVRDLLEQLTSEERQVVEEIAAGKTIKQIAQSLSLSLRTIQFRRSSAMKKLHATRSDVFELVFKARKSTDDS